MRSNTSRLSSGAAKSAAVGGDVRIGFALPAADLVRQGKKEICVRSSPEAERIDGFAPAPEFQPL
jgi:hypothetical protein